MIQAVTSCTTVRYGVPWYGTVSLRYRITGRNYRVPTVHSIQTMYLAPQSQSRAPRVPNDALNADLKYVRGGLNFGTVRYIATRMDVRIRILYSQCTYSCSSGHFFDFLCRCISQHFVRMTNKKEGTDGVVQYRYYADGTSERAPLR